MVLARNLLSANQETMETSSAGWVAAGGNTTYTRDNAPYQGTWAAKIVATAGGDYAKLTTPSNVTGVVGGQTYQMSCFMWGLTAGFVSYYLFDIDWYNAGATYLSSSFHSNLPALAGGRWDFTRLQAQAPATATNAQLYWQFWPYGAGDTAWLDTFYFGQILPPATNRSTVIQRALR